MTDKSKKNVATKVVAGGNNVRFSYAHVFVPTSMEPDDPKKKYSVQLLIPKKDKVLVEQLKKAINAAKEIGKADKWKGQLPANLRNPLRDGDKEHPDEEAYKGMYFINATSVAKPGIIDKDRNPLTSEDDFYSGCYGRFSINFFPYDAKGNRGVGCGLNHLQKTKDGERLGGRASVDEDFNDDWEDPESDSSSEEDDDLM